MADNEKRKTAPQESSRRTALRMVGLAAATAFLAKSRVAAAAAESTPAKASTVKASTTPAKAKASTVKASTTPPKASTVKASTAPAKASTVKASTTQRIDPYKNFKFRVMWDGRTIAGFSKVRGLNRASGMFEHPDSSRKSPGRTKYEAITLERGVTHDQDFEKWANRGSFKGRRMDIVIERYNEAGRRVEAFKIFRCWVSEFQALPDLDANANAVAIQRLKLENEGWERDSD